MIINIALGILVGVVLIVALIIVLAIIAYGFSRLQERIEKEEKTPHVRIRPEEERFIEMQKIKAKAKESHPEHWRDKREQKN